jgi:DNA-binding response OmpR family regulator
MTVASEIRLERPPAVERMCALIVEPTSALARLLPGMFDELGFDAYVVAKPEDAFAAAETGRKFDLLVTELTLPEISGRTVAGFITTRRPETPVLYLCDGGAGPSVEQPGVVALEKPFSLEELVEAVQRLLGSASR